MDSITGHGAARSAGALILLVVLGALLDVGARGEDPAANVRDGDRSLQRLGPALLDAEGRFENRIPGLPRAGPSVTLPFFWRRVTSRFRTPDNLPLEIDTDVGALHDNARIMRPTVTWVGHSTLLVQMAGATFLTDPIWSQAAGPGGRIGARRWLDAALPIQQLPRIDFVLISHNHYDHLDLPSLREIAERSPHAVFFVPLENGELLRDEGIERVVELDWGDRRSLGAVTVHCLPAQHWSQRGIGDQRRALWASWAVTSFERRFYFGGDTGLFDGFRTIGDAFGPFDLAAVPVGAYEPHAIMAFSHMDPEQAVDAALDVGARRMLAIHHGTFDLADEPPGEPAQRFREAAHTAGLTEEEAWTLAIGETRGF